MTRIALAPVGDRDIEPLHAMLLELGASDGVADIRTTEASLRAALSGPARRPTWSTTREAARK